MLQGAATSTAATIGIQATVATPTSTTLVERQGIQRTSPTITYVRTHVLEI